MLAVQFHASIPRYALGRAAAPLNPAVLWNGLSCTQVGDVPEPRLPSAEWVKLKTRYGGICGSDLSSIHLRASPYLSAFTSFPFTFGHENVGQLAEVGEQAGDWRVGERVVVEPLLWCRPRGFHDLCRYCARGEINLCERTAQGKIGAGLLIGGCRDTGGSWSPYFVAHHSQLYRVPANVSDENALLVEPFAVALHAVLQNMPRDDETVLVLGAGIIGLLTAAALRGLGSHARLLVMARYGFQADAARRLGASDIIPAGRGDDYYADLAARTGGQVVKPLLGKRALVGGVDRTFECVGSASSIEDALRLTRAGGRVVLVGVPGEVRVDWSPLFVHELEVRAAYGYHHAELFAGERVKTFGLVLGWMARGQLDLSWLVTHKFQLQDYARAFSTLEQRGRSRALKAVFEF